MNRYLILAATFAMSFAMPMAAQTKKAAKGATAEQTIERYINEYKFAEAQSLANKELKRNKANTSLATLAEKAALGDEMLRGTERVLITDSLATNEAALYSSPQAANLFVAKGTGTIMPTKNFLEKSGLAHIASRTKGKCGNMAFINSLGDIAYFSLPDKSGQLRLYSSFKVAHGKWSEPEMLEGIANDSADHDYPCMMQDGTTLYFASKSKSGLGGYDIYVTRYDPDSKKYVKQENIGMPYNSPDDDYFYCVNENSNIGWFASKRRQPNGKICIYAFVPSETRTTYDPATPDELQSVRKAAMLSPLKDVLAGEDAKQLASARDRLKKLGDEKESQSEKAQGPVFVINDNTNYTSLSEFKTKEGRDIARQLIEVISDLDFRKQNLAEFRERYHSATQLGKQSLTQQILKLEKDVLNGERLAKTMQEKMRQYENKAISQ